MENLIRVYFREISKSPLLGKEDEVRLGKKIETCHKGVVRLLCEYAYLGRNGALGILKDELEEKKKGLRKTKEKLEKEGDEDGLEIILEEIKETEGKLEEVSGWERRIKRCKTRERVREHSEEVFGLVYDALPKICFKRIEGKLVGKLEEDGAVKGDRLRRIRKRTKEYLIKEGEAKRLFVDSNLRLVPSIAKEYYRRAGKSLKGMGYLDIIQEGNIGLMRATDMFDYRRGFRFSTFAVPYIRRFIERGMFNRGKTIRIPANAQGVIDHYKKTEAELIRETGERPGFGKVRKRMKERYGEEVEDETLKAYLEALKKQPLSLEKEIGENWRLMHVVKINSPAPEEVCQQGDLEKAFSGLLSGLSEREEMVLRKRFGVGGGDTYSLREIGDEIELTREMIRQIETKGLRKLRKPKVMRGGAYLGGF